MGTDADGDSQMASSREASPAGARTPTNVRTAELSPPGSQTQTTAAPPDSQTQTQGSSQQQPQQQQQKIRQPGASWMNKRAEEEYQRAMEHVIDQDFSLDEFGDPFDDRDMLLPQRDNDLTCEENRIHFTPVKTARSAPRVWDRKPSTSFLARSKSRKVWKRFRTSFNSLKMLEQMVAAEDAVDDEPQLEINGARNAEFLRGVKRRFLLLENSDQDRNSTEQTHGRSFLETKWESEATGRKHKLPASGSDLVVKSDAMAVHGSPTGAISEDITPHGTTQPTDTSKGTGPVQAGVDESESVSPPPEAPTDANSVAAYPSMLHGESSCLHSGVEDESTDLKTHGLIDQPGTDLVEQDGDAALAATMTNDPSGDHEVAVDVPPSPAPGAPVQDLPAELESTLVRSALRSSLDGEDAQLLNNFLFKAKAKREAKAAAMVAHDEGEKSAEAPEGVDSPVPQSTPQSRRVLKDLDANSPSPQKSPQRSPVKPPQRSPQQSPKKSPKKSPQRPTLSPTKPREQAAAPDRQQPASPRRSTRTRTPKPPARAPTPTVRNTLSLRRPKGTEFIFNHRTEAQELALATRRNTRQNRGDALMPKYALQHLEDSPAAEVQPDAGAEDTQQPVSTGRKQVSWNDAQLVQFQGDGDGDDDSDGKTGSQEVSQGRSEKRKATSRGTRSKEGDQDQNQYQSSAAPTNAPATATPKARRMRRLGTPKSAEASLDPSASPPLSSSSSLGGTPDRRKLTPKSAKPTSLFSSRPSLRSSVHNSSLLQSHAGSTPVPRRVRSRT
ncbi:uncharacterized protein BDW47DRAFT_121566 [Aspergillus candidus]|uniref:Uncharacterized protein n=1 Tax=Aspergillus candidus TaxID=41067 RepID=A0A2I2FPA2_ASPCN|nr:hypothetical protein BDW47DRAFT_121566 [Aspergillus candidus]PLB42457.1 hypothetical protein BDW47DRAFT_121566 [Aspergillus candidus]